VRQDITLQSSLQVQMLIEGEDDWLTYSKITEGSLQFAQSTSYEMKIGEDFAEILVNSIEIKTGAIPQTIDQIQKSG
jgi:hypothetical protein